MCVCVCVSVCVAGGERWWWGGFALGYHLFPLFFSFWTLLFPVIIISTRTFAGSLEPVQGMLFKKKNPNARRRMFVILLQGKVLDLEKTDYDLVFYSYSDMSPILSCQKTAAS